MEILDIRKLNISIWLRTIGTLDTRRLTISMLAFVTEIFDMFHPYKSDNRCIRT